MGKGIETRYYEFGRIGYSGSDLIYGRRINPLKDIDVSSVIIDDLTRYYLGNPVGETYNNWIKTDYAKVFSKVCPVFKVCVVDTTVGKYRWFVSGTGEEINSDIAVLTPYKDESRLSLEHTKQVDGTIKILMLPTISVGTAPVLPVVVSSSTLRTLSELSQDPIEYKDSSLESLGQCNDQKDD